MSSKGAFGRSRRNRVIVPLDRHISADEARKIAANMIRQGMGSRHKEADPEAILHRAYEILCEVGANSTPTIRGQRYG